MVGWSLARTVFTEKGNNYFDKFNMFVQEILENPSLREHNPCTTLETTYQLDKVITKEDEIHKPIEINENLQATDIIVNILIKEKKYVNKDNTIWEKVHGTKMTFKKTNLTVDTLIHKLSRKLGKHRDFVLSYLNDIKEDLMAPYIDEDLIRPVPRISMTYRMIELKDGFFDIINKCIYREQDHFVCWIYCPTISVDKMYDLINTNLLNKNNLYWQTAIAFGIFYIEYFADLYQQNLPRSNFKDIFCQVSDNPSVLLYLISPMSCLYPAEMQTIILSQMKLACSETKMNPVIYPESSIKLIDDNILLNKKGITRSGSCHLLNKTDIQSQCSKNKDITKFHFLHKHDTTDFYPIVDIDEAIYIILFTGLCSLARDNKWSRLYKFPIYETMPDKNKNIFQQSMEYLYGEHCKACRNEHVDMTELAFPEDKISLQCNMSFSYENITRSNLALSSTNLSRKKVGRPPKEKNEEPLMKRAVGRPPKIQKEKNINV